MARNGNTSRKLERSTGTTSGGMRRSTSTRSDKSDKPRRRGRAARLTAPRVGPSEWEDVPEVQEPSAQPQLQQIDVNRTMAPFRRIEQQVNREGFFMYGVDDEWYWMDNYYGARHLFMEDKRRNDFKKMNELPPLDPTPAVEGDIFQMDL